MTGIKEISSRTGYFHTEGIAYGPISVTEIDAEMQVEVDGMPAFLFAQWVDLGGDLICCTATHESLYDVFRQLNDSIYDDDRSSHLIEEKERIEEGRIDDPRCDKYFPRLIRMIREEMLRYGLDPDEIFDDSGEDESTEDG